jgi:hypothetical protein
LEKEGGKAFSQNKPVKLISYYFLDEANPALVKVKSVLTQNLIYRDA